MGEEVTRRVILSLKMLDLIDSGTPLENLKAFKQDLVRRLQTTARRSDR